MKKKLFSLVLAIVMIPGALLAQSVLRKVKSLPVVKGVISADVQIVSAKDMGDIYELVVQRQQGLKHVVYATKDGAYLLLGGNIVNKDKVNLTQAQESEVNRVDVSTLPLKDAFTIKKGNGAKKLIMFDDVDCPFCRRAYSWLKTKDNYTLYVFFDPLNIHPQSYAHTVSILCSKNPVSAFDQVMSGQNIAETKCDAATRVLAGDKAVVDRVGVDGTPLFITDSGARIVGFQTQQLESYLGK